MHWPRAKARIEEALYAPESRLFLIVNDFLAALTILSVLALILETVRSLAPYHAWFVAMEYIAVFFFTLEYFARILVTNRKRHYLLSFFGIIDLLAILPSYLALSNLTFLKTARVLRLLRFLRMLRVAKLARTGRGRRARKSVHGLTLQLYFFALLSAVVIFGTLLYVAEGGASEAANIPLAMLWITKVIMGGVAQTMPESVWGDLVIVATRFTGLMLFGLLVFVVGDTVKRVLFGGASLRSETAKP